MNMETQNPLNAQIGNRGLRSGRNPARSTASRPSPNASSAPASAGGDWQASGLIDRMSAYRDWWNLPPRKPQAADKAAKAERSNRSVKGL
ncbi:MAG TPA: hypothetical protein VJ385_10830 [Fibrobacteria bacterium]|nr:hypothetical protein [Fibrobacteria bacterium]